MINSFLVETCLKKGYKEYSSARKEHNMAKGPYTITTHDSDPDGDGEHVQGDLFAWPKKPKPASAADQATDEVLKGLDEADPLTRAARLAGTGH